ncbi:MAG: BglG family transcription antiterminator [Beduini sp.]|uniref:BglG family transcription antiterminator n=1 Tax=Beduini sp. TaxID=1922300 RepID=UPI0039A32432
MNIIEFLRFLYSHSRVLSLRELSYITALSDRTIRTIIAEANDQSETLGCHIDLIRSVGYQLIIEDQTLFSKNVLLKKEYALKSIEFDILSELFQSPFIKIDELCSRYYVSKGTINKTIKHLKEKLGKYGLQILSKPYLGLYITGSEYQKRKLMIDTGIYMELNPIHQKNIQDTFDVYEIQYNENVIRFLSHYLGLIITRQTETACLIDIDEKSLPLLAVNVATDIFNKTENLDSLNSKEVCYFADLLTMTVILPSDGLELTIRERLTHFNQRMIEKYQCDLTLNFILYEQFLKHLLYLNKRIHEHYQHTNIGFAYYRLNSSLGYEISLEFIQYFFPHQEIYEEETGMLALYFCLFLQNANIQYYGKKTKIAIAVPRFDLTAELFISLFKNEQSNEILASFTFKDQDKIRAFKPDLIFTFEPFKLDHYSVIMVSLPIFQIYDNGFVKNLPIYTNQESYLQRKRKYELLSDVQTFFSPENFFVNKKFKNTDQLFNFLVSHLNDYKMIDNAASVIEERVKLAPITKEGSIALLCPVDHYAAASQIVFISLNGAIELEVPFPVHILITVLYKNDQDKKTMLLMLQEIFDTFEHIIDIYEQSDYDSFIQYLDHH